MPRSQSLIALLSLLGTLAAVSAQAQVFVAPQPGYPPGYGYGQFGQNGPGLPYGPNGQNGTGFNRFGPTAQTGNGYGPNGNPQGQGPTSYLPNGIDHMWANEGTNQILLYATADGYKLARQIIKGLDGDWNITRTQVVQVREKPSYLTTLGVTPEKDGTFSPADVQKLLAARRDGKLTASQTVRIESGNDEETDTTMGLEGLALSLTTHIASGSQIRLDLTAPLSATLNLRPGETTVVASPPSGSDSLTTLLFLTPTIQSQG